MSVKININDYTKVKFTEIGMAIFKNSIYYSQEIYPDLNSEIRIPLWYLMAIFGPHIHCGSPTYFEKNIINFE